MLSLVPMVPMVPYGDKGEDEKPSIIGFSLKDLISDRLTYKLFCAYLWILP